MEPAQKITPEWIAAAKSRGERIPALTAYDYPTARLLDEAGVPIILVGDSVGMVVLGYPDTTHVTLDEIRHHVAAVARAKTRALVVADLPYHTYQTADDAVKNARLLIEAGADAVKLEGGVAVLPEINAIREAGVPLMAHIGMLPQSVKEEGGYKIKGRGETEKERLRADAFAVEKAGAFAIVMELVEPGLAREITGQLTIPTIALVRVLTAAAKSSSRTILSVRFRGSGPNLRSRRRMLLPPFAARRRLSSGTSGAKPS